MFNNFIRKADKKQRFKLTKQFVTEQLNVQKKNIYKRKEIKFAPKEEISSERQNQAKPVAKSSTI